MFRSRSCFFSSRVGCSFRSSACWQHARSSPSSRCQVCFHSLSNFCASRSSCRGECICVECCASSKRTLGQIGLTLAFLPNDAFLSLTAIGQTLWRVFVTRRHLLEWVTSAKWRAARERILSAHMRAMWFAPAIALGERSFFRPDATGALDGCPAILRSLAGHASGSPGGSACPSSSRPRN